MMATAAPTIAAERFEFATTADLDALREPWTALAERSDNVFASFEWLSAWWRHFGRDRPLLLTTVHDADGELVAILPLYLASRRPLRVLRLLGHGATDQLGPICATADKERARQALAAFLTDGHGEGVRWDLAIADELPATTVPLGRARLLARAPTHVVPLASTGTTSSTWLATRSPNLRSQLARAERRLQRAGSVGFRTTDDPASVDRDLDLLLDLHSQRWAAEGGSRSFTGREAFHHEVARTFLRLGWLRLRFLEVDGAAVAGVYSFRFDGVESHYQSGRNTDFDRCSVGLILHAHTIQACADEGVREYRFLRGDESYKRRMADQAVDQESLAWGAGPLGSATGAAIAHLPRLTRTQARWVPASLAWGTGGTPRWGAP